LTPELFFLIIPAIHGEIHMEQISTILGRRKKLDLIPPSIPVGFVSTGFSPLQVQKKLLIPPIFRTVGIISALLRGIVAIGLSLSPALAILCPAQFYQAFDSSAPSWERRESDCGIVEGSWSQKRIQQAETNERFERIVFQAGSGSKVLLAHEIPPCYVIPELNPVIQLRGDRGGVQLLVRVVLPETPSPIGTGPLTLLLTGPTYPDGGFWKSLSMATEKKNLHQKLQEEIWLLRRKYGSHISAKNAYVDQVVLNLYSGPGKSLVEIASLTVEGIVDAQSLAVQTGLDEHHQTQSGVQTIGFMEPIPESIPFLADKRPSLVVRDGTVLLVDKTPLMARIIQHRGESFEYLRSLGFNVIELAQTARPDQLEAARRLNLWLVCPPPPSIGLAPIGFEYDRVIAWSIGENLTGRNLPNIQQKVREIRESDQRDGRPIVGNIQTHWTLYAQELDILSFGLEPIGTSFLASQYSEWLKQRSQSIEHNKPIWADIQTDFPEGLIHQIRSVANVMPPIPIEPQQVQYLLYEAMSGGARGFRFKSRSRLDGTDPTTRLRALTLEWINAQLDRFEPWVAGGALREPLSTNDRELEVNVISTNRARLLLIQRNTHQEQYLAGDVPLRSISFRDSENYAGDRASWLLDAGLQSILINRNFSGSEIQIDNCPSATAIVLSQDATVNQRLNQSYQRIGRASAHQLHIDLTRQWLTIMELIESQLARLNRSSPEIASALAQASVALQNANRFSEANSFTTASPFLLEANQRLAYMRREIISEPLGLFQSKTSSPLLSHVSLTPLHWELADRLQDRRWNPNGLAGGDFENLDHLLRAGWENRRLDDDRIGTMVQLTDNRPAGGTYALRLDAFEKSESQRLEVDAPPLWITTPRISVRRGQLVRIHGWVNVPRVIGGNADGLMITDSLGGEAMAERIPITDGWQEFTLYRGVFSDTDLQLTFTLSGLGTALIDEVTIRTVDLPSSSRQAQRDE
jgi:hypothetical protein